MTGIVWLTLLLAPAAVEPPPEPVQKYLERCASAQAQTVAAVRQQIEQMRKQRDAGQDVAEALKAAEAQLKKLSAQAAPWLPLEFPLAKGNVGVLVPATAGDPRGGKSADVLEVVGPREAIVRLWYVPAKTSVDSEPSATFVDVWISGIDTSGLDTSGLDTSGAAAGRPIAWPQVFWVKGSKTFDTTCGGRGVPLLEAVDLDRYLPQPAR